MKKKIVFVAGHNGMVGSAICRSLQKDPSNEVLLASRSQLDLTNQEKVVKFFHKNNIDEVYLAAAKVGGIHANNSFPADFIYQNLMIQTNIIHSANDVDIDKLLFLGSSCIYPAETSQPMSENALLSGSLESTNRAYAIAKIAGLELCNSFNKQYNRDYRCVMPTNLYGENDNFNLTTSHVIPALIAKFHHAVSTNQDEVIVWGSGNPMREFLHVEDLADACIYLMNLKKNIFNKGIKNDHCHINVGSGEEVSISELVKILTDISRFEGRIVFDKSMPDGTKRKLLNLEAIHGLGWKSKIPLESGLRKTYEWYQKQSFSKQENLN